MLEIVAMFFLCGKMGKILRKKGRKPLLMQIAVVVTWVGSMFLAAFAYGIYLTLTRGPEAAKDAGFIVYPIMLGAAVVVQFVLFGIANALSSKGPPPIETSSSVRYDPDA